MRTYALYEWRCVDLDMRDLLRYPPYLKQIFGPQKIQFTVPTCMEATVTRHAGVGWFGWLPIHEVSVTRHPGPVAYWYDRKLVCCTY